MEARYYEKLAADRVRCLLCPHSCLILPGARGRCRVRSNRGGTLEAGSYGQLASVAVDPIEKKPLFHFHPGSSVLSAGPNGCNLSCRFCQNFEISQQERPTQQVTPGQLVDLAARQGAIGIAYTYTEPLLWFEYLLDVCALARQAGLVNVLVTNGTINEEPLAELLPLIDAMNIDLKSMDEGFYRDVCGGDLAAVLRTIALASRSCHVELTNLVIPGSNDSERNMDDLIGWVAGLNRSLPLHLSRYHPMYRMTVPATPEATLVRFHKKAIERLDYVYVGNVRIKGLEDTHCPQCHAVLIARQGFAVAVTGIEAGACRNCGRRADVIFGRAP
jgi:pyruvate formate lyase activating enzyme